MTDSRRDLVARLRRTPRAELTPDELALVTRIERAGYGMIAGLPLRTHKALTRRRLERLLQQHSHAARKEHHP